MSGNESIAAAHYDQVTTWPRDGLQADIVHIGFGAFHRGHQAVYTDLTNQLSDTRWGIFEINLFGDAQLIENLNAQNRLFSVVDIGFPPFDKLKPVHLNLQQLFVPLSIVR